ncbi:hypothetical protein G3O08_10680 [Cryomorpha ignava]|uniref:Lipoprotein n=1 Tax=Cryomorpha ignava TaxID=101383 RepID=A0A7K3WR68_9FLAO|nr:hypothetical protein [Cryomorpha ignava]NEN23964.1 hypothetical protein [Cryomorpha ignava]
MRRIILLLVWAFIVSSCAREKECEAFDKSREIAKWHLFPALDSVYIFSSDNQEMRLTKERGILSELETKECGFNRSCDCRRYYIGYYGNDSHYIRSNIIYDEDGDPIYRPAIFYEFDEIYAWFEVTSSGEMLRVADDTTSSDPVIEFENLENLTIDEQEYQDVLHLLMPEQSEISDYWVARNMGLVALQKDSILFTRK